MSSAKAGSIIALVFIILMSIFGVLLWQSNVDAEKRIAQGCHSEAFNKYGMVTIWSCPIDVED
jgi:hypothetical protein